MTRQGNTDFEIKILYVSHTSEILFEVRRSMYVKYPPSPVVPKRGGGIRTFMEGGKRGVSLFWDTLLRWRPHVSGPKTIGKRSAPYPWVALLRQKETSAEHIPAARLTELIRQTVPRRGNTTSGG